MWVLTKKKSWSPSICASSVGASRRSSGPETPEVGGWPAHAETRMAPNRTATDDLALIIYPLLYARRASRPTPRASRAPRASRICRPTPRPHPTSSTRWPAKGLPRPMSRGVSTQRWIAARTGLFIRRNSSRLSFMACFRSPRRGRACRSNHHELPSQHAHLALELELTGFIGHELHGDRLSLGKLGALLEIRKEHHLRTGGRLGPHEVEPHRLSPLDDDHVWRVAALHEHHYLLIAGAREAGFHSGLLHQPEEPDDEGDGGQSDQRDENTIGCHSHLHLELIVHYYFRHHSAAAGMDPPIRSRLPRTH